MPNTNFKRIDIKTAIPEVDSQVEVELPFPIFILKELFGGSHEFKLKQDGKPFSIKSMSDLDAMIKAIGPKGKVQVDNVIHGGGQSSFELPLKSFRQLDPTRPEYLITKLLENKEANTDIQKIPLLKEMKEFYDIANDLETLIARLPDDIRRKVEEQFVFTPVKEQNDDAK